MKTLFAFLLAVAAVPSLWAAETPIPAGTYTLDKPHASLIFRVEHMGFSHYTARFSRFDAKLEFDPSKPESARVSVSIDPRSLTLNSPPAGFKEQLLGPQWLDVGKFPQMTFRSTKVEVVSGNRYRVTGDLTLHGVTHPVMLETTFNGGYAGMSMDPRARIGFSARGTFRRSDFGISYGIPAPGTTMGVGDEVEVAIEAEFNGPALKTQGAASS